MALQLSFNPCLLRFKFEAGTSRGILTEKKTWILEVTDAGQPGVTGRGECGPLKGLSVDDLPDFEEILTAFCTNFNGLELEVFPYNLQIIVSQLVPDHLPALRFGLETALLDFLNGGVATIFKNDFSEGKTRIPINGLVWMGEPEFMQAQINAKISEGYTTIKIKVGAIDFEEECRLIASIRSRFSKQDIALRLDANGAFSPDDALDKLKVLAAFDIHSIEQPIRQGNWLDMAKLVRESPIEIALDEELIGIWGYRDKQTLLKTIRPQFIILKPTLLGGFQQCREWIEIASKLGICWWITSALESNIGLNAVAQFTAEFVNPLPQGLGTGQLYHNNIASGLVLENGYLNYSPNRIAN